MKADVYNLEGKKASSVDLPKQFKETIRPDIIKKANEALEGNSRQRTGAFVGAGIRAAAEMSRRRKKFQSSYGRGISRVPRKHMWRRGTQFYHIGAFAPGTVSGRRAHPPKPDKIFSQKINKNERRMAIRSAISSTIVPDIVKARGHRFTDIITVIDNKAETLSKTKDVKAFLLKLNLQEELKRVSVKKIRSGRGTMRNRKYRTKKGPLLVVSKKCELTESGINISGVEVCEVKNLNVRILAPGGNPGRLTLFTQNAIKKMEDENLFFQKKKKTSKEKTEKKEVPVATKKIVKTIVKKAAKKTIKKTVKKIAKKVTKK
tara:strand:- start:3484 stop:4437 length:954 start_codon:yes stop_codon:yes gene_type:complete